MALIRLRHDTAANWTAFNPVLASGEVGAETDTGKMKVGDGLQNWNARPYASLNSYSDLGGLKTINGSSLVGTGDLTVAGVGGQVDATDVTPFTAALPFDVTGFGSRVVAKTLTSSVTLSLGPGAVEGGACEVIFIGDGDPTHTVVFPAGWVQRGTDVIDTSAGGRVKFVGEYTGSPSATVVYSLIPLPSVTLSDSTPPTLVSATVADATPDRIDLVWSEAIASSGVTAAPFAVNSGHPLTAHTYVDSTHTYLTTSTPFVPGETKTLAYTQPGTNKFQDISGNLLANFSGTAITDNVSAPTLVSAIVANATPTRIDLTWSENMNSTISSHTAFAVSSGHTLTGHTYVDATHSYLTTSTAFVASETKTLSYTAPGTNPMKDAGGTALANFSGTAITDNVSGGGKITFTDTFTGANGSAPNARWTADASGWTIQSNALDYAGSVYSGITADCTAGDNTLSADLTFTSFNTYFSFYIRYVDANNFVDVQIRSDNSEKLRLRSCVAGVITTIADDTVDRIVNHGTVNVSVAMTGNNFVITCTGPFAGSFSGSTSAHSTATKIGFGMNTGMTGNAIDNAVLA